ncbi:hypothetical protein M422DRAFT_246083 [Sphaerobolus stellatus SS14]|nr:hypothetical protein M422DRAFT_246083 [Sphaerobolus stellatus SS14]
MQPAPFPVQAPMPMQAPQAQAAQAPLRRNLYKTNVGPLWLNEFETATQRHDTATDVKSARREMAESMARTVSLVIWFQNGVEPLELQREILTFPHFKFSSFPDDLKLLEMAPSHCLDMYELTTSKWASPSDKSTTLETIGPKALVCPYCETVWPANPSVELQCMRAKLDSDEYSHAIQSPSCSYAHHAYKHYFSMQAELCHQHLLESEAASDKWPASIDFEALLKRLEIFVEELNEIEEFKNTSSLKARSSLATYGRFQKYHAGYYGGHSAVIIATALGKLFPCDANTSSLSQPFVSCIDPETIHPLDRNEFVDCVLVPEAAILLIAADLHLVPDEAEKAWAESASYGRLNYPASDDDLQQKVICERPRPKPRSIPTPIKRESSPEPVSFTVIQENNQEVFVIDDDN